MRFVQGKDGKMRRLSPKEDEDATRILLALSHGGPPLKTVLTYSDWKYVHHALGTGHVSYISTASSEPATYVVLDDFDFMVPISLFREPELIDSRITAARLSASLGLLGLFVPKRLSSDEIGDAVESLYIMARDPGCPRWRMWVKVATTWFWVAINAVREIRSAWGGKKAE